MECAICLNEMYKYDQTELTCNHKFCKKCILNNLHHLQKCPLCRKPLVIKNKTFDCKSIKDALYILIQVTFTLIILTGFTMWLIFIRYIVLYFPNFITFVMGYCACALVIASALFHIDKLFELNSLEPTYLSIM